MHIGPLMFTACKGNSGVQQMVPEQLDIYIKKNKNFAPYLSQYAKINSNWIVDLLSLKQKRKKRKKFDLELGKDFLDKTSRSMILKPKNG